MVPIQEMSRSGKALKIGERITISVPFDYFIEKKFYLIDVLPSKYYEEKHIKGALNVCVYEKDYGIDSAETQ